MGCGTGTSSLIWGFLGYHVIGIEIQPGLCRDAIGNASLWKEFLDKRGGSFTAHFGSYYPSQVLCNPPLFLSSNNTAVRGEKKKRRNVSSTLRARP